MHQQIRVDPSGSPWDVELLLRRLRDGDVNLNGAGGSNVEFGGRFAIAVAHDQRARTLKVLRQWKYKFDIYDSETKDSQLATCFLRNETGQLHDCIAAVAAQNLRLGRIIRDVLIGVTEGDLTPVQVFSEEVRTPQTVVGGARGRARAARRKPASRAASAKRPTAARRRTRRKKR